MIRILPRLLMTIAILLAFIPSAFAETRTVSWGPVTAYTDQTLIETGNTIKYSVYWTTDPGLGTLRAIGTSLATTSAAFDPTVQGMTRGGTVYFTAKSVLGTGEESSLAPAYSWVVPLVPSAPATLSGIAISGPSSVNEGGTGTYRATATWSDSTTTSVAPAWSENSSFATISTGGLLTASAVTSNQTMTVTASYGGLSGTTSVTIVDVDGAAPAAPKNVGIAGPMLSTSTEIWRINWDSVTTTWDGTPIDPVRTVRYTAYWTDDPALSAASLRPLASLVTGTTLDFDPSANTMKKNQVVYLTVRAILDTGDQSSLAASLAWRVENAGPVAPGRGKISRK